MVALLYVNALSSLPASRSHFNNNNNIHIHIVCSGSLYSLLFAALPLPFTSTLLSLLRKHGGYSQEQRRLRGVFRSIG